MFGFIMQVWVVTLVLFAVVFGIWYMSLSNDKRMKLKSLPVFVYPLFVVLYVIMWFIMSTIKTATCEIQMHAHEAEDYKFDVYTNQCLLKDPVSKRFVLVSNYGRG